MVASNCGHSKVVKELANRGADLNLATVHNLSYAAKEVLINLMTL